MDLDGYVFVITGAAQGIGATTARTASQYGATVMLSDVLDEPGLALAEEINDNGGQAAYCHCDISNEDEVINLMAVTAKEFGGIDVLHNNAGIHETQLTKSLDLETLDIQVFDQVLGVNLRGTFLASKAAVPYLKLSNNASIISAGSIAGIIGYPMTLAYGTSKAGIILLTKAMAVDLAPHRIRSNCYCPGTIDTAMVSSFLEVADDPVALEGFMMASHLVHRMGDPIDVAELVCFLASKQSSFINGQAINIDGGSLSWRGTVDALGIE